MGDITTSSLDMLLARLLWPMPRVRWEAMRGLAALIRGGDKTAAAGLLDWISRRSMESEVVLGLTIIDAFDLGAHFNFAQVHQAVNAASHLSDWLLKRNFADAANLFPFRYAYAPETEPDLAVGHARWFQRYLRWAVPPIFSATMMKLEEATNFPFFGRWEHEWRWLQATQPRPAADFPRYFSRSVPDERGQFDQGQRELYLSAFLRTMAYAATHWRMPHQVAQDYALLGLYLNRGLADLEPIPRPEWARYDLAASSSDIRGRAEALLSAAEGSAEAGEAVIAFTTLDTGELGFLEYEFTMVIGAAGFTDGRAKAAEFNDLLTLTRRGEFGGAVADRARAASVEIGKPTVLVQRVLPADIGRGHNDMIMSIHVASPYVFGRPSVVVVDPNAIRLVAEGKTFSRCEHWYADWAPTMPVGLDSYACFRTTVAADELTALRSRTGMDIAWLVRTRASDRERSYSEPKLETAAFWLSHPLRKLKAELDAAK